MINKNAKSEGAVSEEVKEFEYLSSIILASGGETRVVQWSKDDGRLGLAYEQVVAMIKKNSPNINRMGDNGERWSDGHKGEMAERVKLNV